MGEHSLLLRVKQKVNETAPSLRNFFFFFWYAIVLVNAVRADTVSGDLFLAVSRDKWNRMVMNLNHSSQINCLSVRSNVQLAQHCISDSARCRKTLKQRKGVCAADSIDLVSVAILKPRTEIVLG